MSMLSARDFYNETLKQAGVTPEPEELEKVASAQGVNLEVVKLAKLFYEQLQLDKVPYENEVDRATDAMKMASAYAGYVAEQEQEAVKVADGLLEHVETAIADFVKTNSMNLSAREALKVAALQSESADEYEAAYEAKLASMTVEDFLRLVEEPKTASAVGAPVTSPSVVYQDEFGVAGLDPKGDAPFIKRDVFGLAPDAKDHEVYEMAKRVRAEHELNPGKSLSEIVHSVHNPPRGFFSRNAGVLGAGALGAGALYLMYRHNKQQQEEKDRQLMAMRAAAMPAL